MGLTTAGTGCQLGGERDSLVRDKRGQGSG